MAASRRWFLASVLLTLAIGNAKAQDPITCFLQGAVPPIVRAEGIAELVGDVVVVCTGGTPGTATFLVNWSIFLNTNVTSRLLTTESGSAPFVSEGLLLIDEPSPAAINVAPAGGCPTVAACGTPFFNAFRGQQAAANSIAWIGVPFSPPGTGTTVFRITNIRANASQLGLSGTSLPQTIVMQLSPSGNEARPISNFTMTVGVLQPSIAFATVSCSGGSGSAPALLQCASQNAGSATSNTTAATSFQFGLRYTENFATAFGAMGGVGTAQDPSVPGTVYNTESGFVNSSALGPETGQATQGTRLMATFNNIPAGVVIYIGAGGVYGASGTSPTVTAALVTTDATASGGTPGSIAATFTSLTCGSASPSGSVPLGFAPLILSGGTGVAVWEITAASPFQREQLVIPMAVAYLANTANNQPGSGTVTATGNLAPVSTVMTASNSAPVPRFASNPDSASAFVISACVTNLLFPFVTNQAGFDTSLVVSNTSSDPFGTPAAAGACSINYYGQTTGGGAAPAPQLTAVVPAGGQLPWSLSAGGSVPATAGFQGYIIAQCKFPFAHGFAFISDVGAQKISMGYLALVMDGAAATIPRTGSFGEPLVE